MEIEERMRALDAYRSDDEAVDRLSATEQQIAKRHRRASRKLSQAVELILEDNEKRFEGARDAADLAEEPTPQLRPAAPHEQQ